MSNNNKQVQQELRGMIEAAVSKGIVNPQRVKEYILDNGWKYPEPWIMTIQLHLKKLGVEYVRGYWTKTR